VIIAGPNGAGKTTFAREFLSREAGCPDFINADLIAQGLSPFAPEQAAIAAGLRNFHRIYSTLVDSWILYDNTGAIPHVLAERENR
jgi:predicted ABC-type ATPase